MSYRGVSLLRDRSLRMLDLAKRSLLGGDYDIAAFMADQAVQLYLKSVILELTGEIPRVYAVRQLFHGLKAVLDRSVEVDQFVRENRSMLIRLEDAYVGSRYIPREYEKDEVEEMVDFAEEAIEFVKSLRGEA